MIPLEGLKEYMRNGQDVFANVRCLVFEKLTQNIVQISASLLDACVLAVLERRARLTDTYTTTGTYYYTVGWYQRWPLRR